MSFLEDEEISPHLFLVTNNGSSVSEFEQRLQELLLQRNQIRPFINNSNLITPFEITEIPVNPVLSFCSEYKTQLNNLENISKELNIINDNKKKLESANANILENLNVLLKFINEEPEYDDIVNKCNNLYKMSKNTVSKNEGFLLCEQEKLTHYISTCIELFKLVEDTKPNTKLNTKSDTKTCISCPVCYERDVNNVFIPCGHTICSICSKKILSRICIICRNRANIIPFYLS
jgi:hypothetical protein